MNQITREYYRIRFPANAGSSNEFYSSRNGTTQWAELSKVKSLITRGMPYGYRGVKPFENYEIVKYTETVTQVCEVISL